MEHQHYEKIREDMNSKISGLKDAFRHKIEEYMDSSESNAIFKQDLYAMVHLAKTDEDLQTLRKMIVRHNKYPINFHFGPIVCRLLYFLNKPEVALQWYKDPETSGIFSDPATSSITIMDHLFDIKMYEQCMEVYRIARDRRGRKEDFISHNTVTLYAGACSRLGTEDSLEEFLSLLKGMRAANWFYTNRTTSYGAYLALKLGHPDTALNIMSEELRPTRPEDSAHAKTDKKTGLSKNLQVACYASLGELKKALDLMITFSVRTDYNRPEMIFPETIQYVEDAVKKSEDTMFQERFDDVMKMLKEGECLTRIPLENYMYRPIYPNHTLKSQNIRMKHRGRKVHTEYEQQREGEQGT